MPDPVKSGYGADHGSSTSKSPSEFGAKPGEPKHDLGSGLKPAGDQLSQAATDAKNKASDFTSQVGKSASSVASSAANEVKRSADAGLGSVRDQAASVASDARSTVSAMADEARQRISEIVDQQKKAGADTVAGVARAAQAAAGDLQQTSPQMARLVRSAADGVDRIAGDIRSSDLNQIVSTLSDFGRRQPVAFFGGAVLAGFILARFLKSDAPATSNIAQSRTPGRV